MEDDVGDDGDNVAIRSSELGYDSITDPELRGRPVTLLPLIPSVVAL
jgi:hypothetical protein